MNKMRLPCARIGLAAIIALLSVFVVFAFAACTDSVDVAELSVVEDTVPGVAVVGQLNLSDIKLIATDSEGATTEIAVTSAMLTTEGRQALMTTGQQNVTIFYHGKTVVISMLIVEEGTETVTVTFLNSDGSALGKRTVIKGEAISNAPAAVSADPSKEFAGWYDGNGKKIDLTAVDADITVTAKFSDNANEYEVRFFDYQNNQIGSTQLVPHGETATAPGWVIPAEIESYEWKGLEVPVTAPKDFYMSVKYRSYQVQYVYVFESNTGVEYDIAGKSGPLVESVVTGNNATKQTEAKNLLAAQNLEFVKWQNTSTVINANTKMIAVVKDRNFTIKYNDGTNDTQTVLSGAIVTLKTNAPQKEGYSFNAQWQAADGTIYSGTITVSQDLVLTPVYNKKLAPVQLLFTFKGKYISATGGDETDVTEKVIIDNTYFGDKIDIDFVRAELEKLKAKNKGEYDKYDVESVFYNNEDVTEDGVALGVNVGDAYHEFAIVAVDASLPTEGLSLEYDEDSDGYVVKGYTGDAKQIYIPADYNDKHIVAIANNAFDGKTIISISIADTVTSIGDEAFANTVLHNDIVLPALTSVGRGLFMNASGAVYYAEDDEEQEEPLTKRIKVVFGSSENSFTVLPGDTFKGTKGIVEVTLPDTVTEITAKEVSDDIAYDEIEKINLNNVETIENYAFYGSASLADIGSFDALKTVGEYAFYNTAIAEIALPVIVSIGSGAFGNNSSLTKLTVATDSVVAEGENGVAIELAAFKNASSLVEIVIGDAVVSVTASGDDLGFATLAKITLGSGVTEFAVTASSLPALAELVVNDNAKFLSADGVLFVKSADETGYELCYYPAHKLGDYTVPTAVGNNDVISVTTDFGGADINALVVTKAALGLFAEEYVFAGNASSIVFDFGTVEDSDEARAEFVAAVEAGMNKFGQKAYYIKVSGIEQLDSLIEDQGWNNTEVFDSEVGTKLKYDKTYELFYEVADGKATIVSVNGTAAEVTVPATLGGFEVYSIASDAFAGCSEMKTLTIKGKVAAVGSLADCVKLEKIEFGGWLEGAVCAIDGFGSTEIGRNNNVLVLDGVLVASNFLADIEEPTVVTAESLAGIKEIPEAFFKGSIITEIYLPDTVTAIKKEAFADCTELEIVDFNKTISVEDSAFKGCSALKSVALPEVVSLGVSAFEECTALESVYIPKKINAGLIPVRGFYNCASLVTVNMPEVVGFASSNNTSAAFFGCTSLSDISFIEKFDKIGGLAFAGCTAIKKVDFTVTSVTEVGAYAFFGCTGIEYIVFSASVTGIGAGAFYCNTGSSVKSIEFKGSVGLLKLAAIPEGVFPESGYTFYVAANADTAALKVNYEGITIKTIAPTVTFKMHENFAANGALNMPALNDTLYLNEAPEAPEFEGYVFNGWFMKQNAGSNNNYIRVSFPYNVTADIELYAKYFDINKGSLADDDLALVETEDGYILNKITATDDDYLYIPAEYKNASGDILPIVAVNMAAFLECGNITEIVLPEGVERIFADAVDGNNGNIVRIVVPSTVTEIGTRAFRHYDAAEEIVFADGIALVVADKTAFDNTAWYNASLSAAQSDSGNGFVIAGNVAIYYEKAEVEVVEVPTGVTVLAAGLFKNNLDVVEVRLNRELQIIGEECFYGAANLEFVSYLSGNRDDAVISTIGNNAFTGTQWLTNQDMVVVGTVLTKYNDHTGADTVTIPDGITEIADEAFVGSSVKNIIFGAKSKLVKIGKDAFKDSKKLESIVLPAVEEIGEGAFSGCTALRSADFGSTTIEALSKDMFSGCSALSKLSLPDTVKQLGEYSLTGCSELSDITAKGITEILGIKVSGIKDTAYYNAAPAEEDTFIIIGKILIKYIAGTADRDEDEIVSVTLPEGIESIMDEVFYNNGTIEEVVLPASVKYIGESAFSNCLRLNKVVFADDGLVEIAADAFKYCTALKAIELPSTLESIGNRAFAGSGLEEITIGDSVVSIGAEAFNQAANLERVAIGSGVSFIGEAAFADCINLYKVEWAWTVDTVSTDEDDDLNVFDVYIANMEEELDIVAEENSAAFGEYVKGLFSGSARSIRIYFGKDSYNYVNNGLTKALEAWKDIAEGITVYQDGVYPTVSFDNDGGNYYMQAFSAEIIESIDAPAMTGRTFKRWLLNGEPLVLPYKVFNDISLTPDWFVNELEQDDSEELSFRENDNGYTVVGIKKQVEDGILYIPSTVKGKPVNGIALVDDANAEYVDKIVLTDASAFGESADNIFKSFKNLVEVSLIVTGSNVCDMKVEDGVVYSEDGTVLIAYLRRYEEDEETLCTEFTIPDSVTTILPYAFVNSGLTTISVGKNVTAIGDFAFNDELAELSFAEGIYLTEATKASFSNTAWYNGGDNDANTYGPTMSQYTINRATVGLFFTAGNLLYEYKWISSIERLAIPDNINGFDITVISGNIYDADAAVSIEDLVLPKYLKRINADALNNINVTKNITISNNGTDLVEIASGVFNDTTYYKTYGDTLILGSVLVKCQNTSGTITVPEGVVAISDEAFYGGQVNKITLPSTLKYIGKYAFYNCTNLAEIEIPASVISIGEGAFGESKKLAKVTFAEQNAKLLTIGDGVFSGCEALTSINIPYTVESIGKEAFMKCKALTTINFDYIKVTANEDNTTTTTVLAKSKLAEIGESAFYECVALKQISVPDGVTVINERTFYNCRQLVSVSFDVSLSNVKSIEKEAFYGCSALGGTVDLSNPSLVTLVLPNRLETIKERAFANCSTLLGVQINYNVATIENYAFYGCLRLAKVDIYSSTPATIAEDTFYRGSDDGTNPYYNLRIYVKCSPSGTILDNYKKTGNWTKYRDNIHENNDLPTLKYRRVTSSGSGADQIDIGVLPNASDIVVDPEYTWSGAVYSSWQYFEFKAKEYNADGTWTGEYVANNSEPRYERIISSLTYQIQVDEKGDSHIILVVDYDEMTLNYKSTN